MNEALEDELEQINVDLYYTLKDLTKPEALLD